MPNLVGHQVDDDGVTLTFAGGRTVSVTRQQIRQRFLSETGTIPQRRSKVLQWIKNQLQSGELSVLLGGLLVTVDFDESTGRPTGLTFSHPET